MPQRHRDTEVERQEDKGEWEKILLVPPSPCPLVSVSAVSLLLNLDDVGKHSKKR